jgi:hypothetical protein
VQRVFDGLEQLTRQTGPGAETATVEKTFEYDVAGRVTGISRPGGSIGVTYNDRHQVL